MYVGLYMYVLVALQIQSAAQTSVAGFLAEYHSAPSLIT